MRRRAVAGLAGLAVVAFAFALVAGAPAARVLHWVDPPGIAAQGVDGRVWAGTAARVELTGRPAAPPLTDVSWDVVVWRLLTGELHADVRATAAGIEADGRIGITPARELRVSDLTLRGPVSGLARRAPLPVAARGALLARIEQARIESGRPRDVRGRAVWSDARLDAPVALALGDVVVEVEPAKGGQRATIEAAGGDLEIAGEAGLDADGRYRLDLVLTPADGAGQRVHDLLQLAGAREDGAGNYVIRRSGRL